jgi:hypothetical protein
MGLEYLIADQPFVHDLYSIGEQSVVKFYCEGKHKTVRAPLSGSFNLNVQSHWNGLFDGAGGGSQLLGILDSLKQVFQNKTISQPWFGRKMWVGTTPFKFSLPIRFVSRFDAYKEVFLPAMGLLSFMYPRLNDEDQIDGKAVNALSSYFLPGPNIFYALASEGSDFNLGTGGGDQVEISMGNFLNFTGCYLTAINLTVENSFNIAGYPHNVGAQVDFEAMDVSFVNFDGGFMETGLGNQAMYMDKVLEGALKTAQDAFNSAEEGVTGGIEKLLNALRGVL